MFDFEKPKRSWLDQETAGNSSIQSWYGEEGSENAIKKRISLNTMGGPLGIFPQLDVMPGSASAFNEGVHYGWGFNKPSFPLRHIDSAKLKYEEQFGELNGFRTFANNGIKEENVVSNSKPIDRVFEISGLNIEKHVAEAPHGMHAISEEIAAAAKDISIQSAMGASQMSRKRGLERGSNPAINGSIGEEAFHNSNNIPISSDTVEPMDIDVIEVNGVEVRVEDTQQALDANTTS